MVGNWERCEKKLEMGGLNKRWQFAENNKGKVTEEVNQWNTGAEKM